MLGAGIPLIFVAFNTLLQKQTPGRLMGRVSASVEVLVTTPQALSIGVGTLLVGAFACWRRTTGLPDLRARSAAATGAPGRRPGLPPGTC